MPSQDERLTPEGMRRRLLEMFSQDWEAVSYFLNEYFFLHGMLANDAQVACHNSAEAFVIFLMGDPLPTKVDHRYVEQLETLMGGFTPLDRNMSGESYIGKDKVRRRKA